MTASPQSQAALPLSHMLLALAVVGVWGTNFVVIRLALDALPPLTFATLRYIFALLPAVFFVARPKVKWRTLAAYGALIGAGQFGLLYIAIDGLISPGLASLVVQTQVFFTIGLAIWLAGERLRSFQLWALLLATIGIGVILFHTDATTTVLGLALVIAAAVSWALGNHVAKASGTSDMLAFVIWASLFAIPPLLIGALIFEGPERMAASVSAASAGIWAAVLWQSIGNTLFGYSVWGWLLSRHPASTIAPTAMLVPVFGMSASALFLGEPLQAWKLIAAEHQRGGDQPALADAARAAAAGAYRMSSDWEAAPAKLNLALHVRERMPDGYHRLETLFVFAADGDMLTVAADCQLSLVIEGPFAAGLSAGDDNLVLRAAAALRQATGVERGGALTLTKNLPVASGIGGGSADAAAALRLLARFWSTDIDLMPIARELGADVPACLVGAPVRGEGRGDLLTPIAAPGLSGVPALLINPRVPMPTGPVFAGWNGMDRGPLGDGDPLEAAMAGRNDLQAPAIALCPVIGELVDWLARREGVILARMSGSGASCFALLDGMKARDRAAAQAARDWPDAWRLATVLRGV